MTAVLATALLYALALAAMLVGGIMSAIGMSLGGVHALSWIEGSLSGAAAIRTGEHVAICGITVALCGGGFVLLHLASLVLG